jgi:hypothetical protein
VGTALPLTADVCTSQPAALELTQHLNAIVLLVSRRRRLPRTTLLELDRPPSAETSFVRRWSAAQRDPLAGNSDYGVEKEEKKEIRRVP